MVIAIGADDDGVLHWCHYVHHHWSQWVAIGTIFCRHLRQWCQWREPQIGMTLLPNLPHGAGCRMRYHKKKQPYTPPRSLTGSQTTALYIKQSYTGNLQLLA